MASLDTDDDAGHDHYASDNVAAATHLSSPISTVRTPPDFSAAALMPLQQQRHFAKQLEGPEARVACYAIDNSSGEVLAYQAGLEILHDPFGLDASLFSI